MSAITPLDSLFSLTESRHRLHVKLRRETSTAEWDQLERSGREVMEEIARRKREFLLLDLSELEYLGSSTIAFLMRIWKHVNQLQGQMVVVIADSRVYEIIRLSGLVKIWTIFDNLKTADRHLREQRRVGRNIGPMLCLLGTLSLVISGGLYGLQWTSGGTPAPALLISQISLGLLALVLLIWAARVFTSGMRWASLLAAALACGFCCQAGYGLFAKPSVAAPSETKESPAATSKPKTTSPSTPAKTRSRKE